MSQPQNNTVQAPQPSGTNTQFVTHIPQAQANGQSGNVRYVQSQPTGNAPTGGNSSQPVQYALTPTAGDMMQRRPQLPNTRMVHIVKQQYVIIYTGF